ncbi:MAG: hypothetical protein K0U74_14690 [Alphaproteobacteria bacterium]|nr:hypothetical protein [Alphaproteobacteria bacterium]
MLAVLAQIMWLWGWLILARMGGFQDLNEGMTREFGAFVHFVHANGAGEAIGAPGGTPGWRVWLTVRCVTELFGLLAGVRTRL